MSTDSKIRIPFTFQELKKFMIDFNDATDINDDMDVDLSHHLYEAGLLEEPMFSECGCTSDQYDGSICMGCGAK